MKYNFDEMPDRFGTDCIKWDYLEGFFGKKGLNALWVADMDFKAPEEILEPIMERAAHGVFGYTAKPEAFYTAVMNWFSKRYGWEIKREWIVATPGVVPALNLSIQTFTEPGDGVIIQPPVYFPFMESVESNGRKLLNNTLLIENGTYKMDFEDLERKAANASMLVLCSPHNPVSRVWTQQELEKLDEICRRNNLTVFSDEIHADIVFKPCRHIPTPCAGNYLLNNSISAYATSKTFNLAGLQLSVNIIPNEKIRMEFSQAIAKLHLNMSNIFGIVGTQAAYSYGEQWLEELLPYLWENYREVAKYLEINIPDISVVQPEGTFLLWLDCRKLNLSDAQLAHLFVHRGKLALSTGELFGEGGSGFMRLNIACPRSNLMKAMAALKTALEDKTPVPDENCCKGGPDDT